MDHGMWRRAAVPIQPHTHVAAPGALPHIIALIMLIGQWIVGLCMFICYSSQGCHYLSGQIGAQSIQRKWNRYSESISSPLSNVCQIAQNLKLIRSLSAISFAHLPSRAVMFGYFDHGEPGPKTKWYKLVQLLSRINSLRLPQRCSLSV